MMRYWAVMFGVWAILGGDALAACTKPDGVGVEGEIVYNRKWKVMQFCDGGNWVGMGGGGSASIGGVGAVQLSDGAGGMSVGTGLNWNEAQLQLHVTSVRLANVLTAQDDARFNVSNGRTADSVVSMPQYGMAFPLTASSAEAWISGNAGISFFTAGTEFMRVGPTGFVGIGTSSPTAKLDVAGNARFANNKAYIGYYNVAPHDQAEFGSVGAATSVSFVTNSQSRMNITPTGNVGIANVDPQAKLHVSGGSLRVDGTALIGGQMAVQGNLSVSNPAGHTYTHLNIGPQANDALISDGGTSYGGGLWFRIHDPAVPVSNYRDVLMLAQNGNVGVSVNNPTYNLHVNGQVAGAGAFVSLSDARMKQEIVPLSYGLASVLALEPVTYEWKTQDEPWQKGRKVGFIAQQVEGVVPEVVSTASDEMGTKSIAYAELVPVLVGAIKELKAQNDDLKLRLERMEKALVEAKGDGL